MNRLLVDNNFIQTVVQDYSDMVIRIAYQNLRKEKDAEDVAQDVFLKLVQFCDSFNDYEHVKAWLIRATINKCKDFRKSAWFRKTVPMTNEQQFKSKEQSEISEIMEEIWQLPENYRNIIYLYYFEGYTIPEIARIISKKVNTVNSQLQRARKKLKNIILEEGDF